MNDRRYEHFVDDHGGACQHSGVDPAKATPDKHIFDDLDVDSLDFLDITFEIDRAVGIRIPVEAWLVEAQAEPAAAQELFLLGKFADRVDAVRHEAAG